MASFCESCFNFFVEVGKDFFLLRLESAFVFCRDEKFWPSFENSAERVLLQSVSFFPRIFVWGSGLPKNGFSLFVRSVKNGLLASDKSVAC